MANAGAISRSCWPELINTVFFIANATFFHRNDGGRAQATGSVVYPESSFPVFDWLSMSSQVSCLGRYDLMKYDCGKNKKNYATIQEHSFRH